MEMKVRCKLMPKVLQIGNNMELMELSLLLIYLLLHFKNNFLINLKVLMLKKMLEVLYFLDNFLN